MKEKDVIDFKVNSFDHSESFKTVDIYINGVSFVESLKIYEKPFAGKLAGGYSGIDNYEFDHVKKGIPIMEDGKFDILTCDCGELGCWSFEAKITESDDSIIWSDFEQPRRDWDYSNFGPFVFDKDDYKEKMSKVPTISPKKS